MNRFLSFSFCLARLSASKELMRDVQDRASPWHVSSGAKPKRFMRVPRRETSLARQHSGSVERFSKIYGSTSSIYRQISCAILSTCLCTSFADCYGVALSHSSKTPGSRVALDAGCDLPHFFGRVRRESTITTCCGRSRKVFGRLSPNVSLRR